MNFNKHSNFKGCHAPFGASNSSWLRYTSEKMEESFLFMMHHLYWKRHWRLRCLKSNFFLTMQAKYFIIHNIDD